MSRKRKVQTKVSGCGELRDSVHERLERIRKAFTGASSLKSKYQALQKLQGVPSEA
ncbi:hypothetical protein SAMN02745181_2332 [Rubritalea squalenifaciens DSM 18772]|uniref:Uncharacterized protein n=2 Tax=Rubritalea TaxID=361050 RepID=A0A1M6L9H0_9BACT|nr:hypothetical protein [Rubritalea squalenifaciens]SHJ67814.1 hypothetical protein SAMN02745181_2332 [Rubritalea squalenifaciens DSM 18772]